MNGWYCNFTIRVHSCNSWLINNFDKTGNNRKKFQLYTMIKHTPVTRNISELVPEAAQYLKKRKDVLFACLFGSMASGTCTPLSDIDIAVYLKKGNISEKRLELIGDLADIFKTDEIDLVILNTAPLSLRMKILKQRKILADNHPFFRHKYESITIRSWFDFSKLEHRILERRFFNGGSSSGIKKNFRT